MMDKGHIATVRELRQITAGQVMVYHRGNLIRDRNSRARRARAIDRKAEIAMSHVGKRRAALVQRRVGNGFYEYRIIATGFMPALHGSPDGN